MQQFRKDFAQLVTKHGWVGWKGQGSKAGEAWRTRLIYETNLYGAYASGRVQQQQSITARRPYWQYKHAHVAVDPREQHLAWDGLVLRADNPWWQTHYPPNGFGCKCYVLALNERDLKRLGKSSPDPTPGDGEYTHRYPDGRTEVLPSGVDPGWNYLPGTTNPAIQAINAQIPRLPPSAAQRAAEIIATSYPLLPAATVTDQAGLEAWMTQIKQAQPDWIPGNVQVTLTQADYFMATYGDGRFLFSAKNNGGFNALDELFGAINAARQGKPLTFKQEYALESLWHEILHNRQPGLRSVAVLPETHTRRKLMETINQFTARHTYPDFLAGMGLIAANKTQVLTQGFGYASYVNNLRTLIAKIGADESAVAAALAQYNLTTPTFDPIIKDLTRILTQHADAKLNVSKTKLGLTVRALSNTQKFNNLLPGF